MTQTPWGATETLGTRARLYSAAVTVVAQKGASAATVADILEVAGLSRATFYKHFPDKRSCLLATIDALAEGAGARIAAELAGEAPWELRLRGALDALCVQIAAYPAAARLCLVDLWALGPAAIERNEGVIAQLEAPFRQVLDEDRAHAGMPIEVTRAIVGGIYKTVHGRLRRGEQETLAPLAGAICAWGIAYEPPPAPIRRPRPTGAPGLAGPQFAAHGPSGRLFAACVAEVSERGYAAVTVDDLARRAQMSLRTLYSLFDGGKEEILLATYDAGVAQGNAVAIPAYERHDSWPDAVRAALEALLTYLSGDPAWARMSIVETLAGGERAMERSDRVIDSYAALLEPGLERNPGLEPIALEATAGAVYTLVYQQVLGDPKRLCTILPLCTYVALAPFVGRDEALAVANGGGRAARRPGATNGREASEPSAR